MPEAGEVSIVGEERHELAEEAEVVVHQVRVSVAPEAVPADSSERKEFCESSSSCGDLGAPVHHERRDMTDVWVGDCSRVARAVRADARPKLHRHD